MLVILLKMSCGLKVHVWLKLEEFLALISIFISVSSVTDTFSSVARTCLENYKNQ